MKQADRQKMCTNCDGRVAYDATQCPYCFTTLQAEAPVQGNLFKSPPSQESLTSLFTPPYSARETEPEEKKSFKKAPEPTLSKIPVEKEATSESKSFWPILLLTLGGNLFTLGVLQFFFSEQGVVQLDINASYWFLFIVLALPLFYFGYKQLGQVQE
jgi:hypothetical protein